MALNKDNYLKNVQRSETPPSSPPPSPPEGSKLTPEKPPPDEIEKTKKKLLREINSIDSWTSSLVDNGLFDKKHKRLFDKEDKTSKLNEAFKAIQGNLYAARKHLYGGDLELSDYYASEALRSYDKALYTPSRLWRFSNVYGGPMWIYLIGFLVAVLAFYWVQLDTNILRLNPPGVRIQEAALHATTWGTVGAILRGLWYLKDKVSDRRYRNSYRIYLLSVPFLGGLFGAILYFMLVAGLFIIAPAQAPAILNQTNTEPSAAQTGSMAQASTSPAGNVSTVAIIPLAALAGFNWEWAIMIFKRIGDSFKGEMESEDKIEK